MQLEDILLSISYQLSACYKNFDGLYYGIGQSDHQGLEKLTLYPFPGLSQAGKGPAGFGLPRYKDRKF